MSEAYGYYLPLDAGVFADVRLLGIEPKQEGFGDAAVQKHTREGVPVWVVTALVRRPEGLPMTELFTLTAPASVASRIGALGELTAVRLVGLEGGKWSRASSDRTTWSFRVTDVQPMPERPTVKA